MKDNEITEEQLLNLIMQIFSNNSLINLLDLFINNEPVVNLDDIAHLNFKYGSGDFLINPETLVIYRKKRIRYSFDKDEKIGRLVFLKNNKLEIESI